MEQELRELKILLLEDNDFDAELLSYTLRKAEMKHQLRQVSSRSGFISELEKFSPDVIVSDHNLPEINSMEALNLARSKKPDVPFILITGSMSEQVAVDCINAGMDDYILKDSLVRLPSSIRNIFTRTRASREKKEIEELNRQLHHAFSEIAEKNKRITDSLKYAKLIQEAMLPEKYLLNKNFPSSFMIFRPKDIVSGDFYWFAEKKGKFMLAVADCTGHGVPGALMSMVGTALLNEIVNLQRISAPAEILKALHAALRKALKQHKTENQRGDGMDIAFCTIDKKRREIQFSGANRHLVFFKKNKLELIKGNKRGIGGLHDSRSASFDQHTVKYEEGDTLYLHTDGYADQFGGAEGRRMMTRNLLRILEKSISFNAEDQQQLLDRWLDTWQGSNEQTDDILLLGIRF